MLKRCYSTQESLARYWALQAVESGSGMPARIPSDLLERVTADITRECPDVQRVFYDCTPSRSYARVAGK